MGLITYSKKTELIIDDNGDFLKSLRQAWRHQSDAKLQEVARLRQRLTKLKNEKDSLVRAIVSSPELSEDIKESVTRIKFDIGITETEIAGASDVETDFDDFVDFAIEYAGNLKHWWSIEDPQDRIRLKELVYPEGLTISRTGKDITPRLSAIYRYKTTKKTPESVNSALIISFGGPGGT